MAQLFRSKFNTFSSLLLILFFLFFNTAVGESRQAGSGLTSSIPPLQKPLPPTKDAHVPDKIPAEGKMHETGDKKPVPGHESPSPKGKSVGRDLSRLELLFAGEKPVYKVSTNLKQFGYDFFRQDVSTFAPVKDVPVGPDYIIGPEDTFTISLWGKVEATYSVTVDRDGKIILPEVGSISVWGLTFSEMKKTLHFEISKYISEFQINVTMTRLRTIRVYVVGNVQAPGSYTVSSLSTMVNVLFACGGPAKKGTLRGIQLIRDGKIVKIFDFYDFLLKGDKSHDERLRPGDTVFVPLTGKVVGIAGSVKNPAIYEMKDKLTIEELLALAGGVTPVGYLQRIQLERIVAHKKSIVLDMDISLTSQQKGNVHLETPLQDLDIIKIYPIIPTTRNIVYLDGHVIRPGGYELKKGMTLSDLIDSYDDLHPEPYLEYAEIIRLEEPDLHEKVIPFNLGDVLKSTPRNDLRLQKYDRVKIYSKWDLKDKYSVAIEGEVRRPGEYLLRENMRVSNLVRAAGDLKKESLPDKAEVFRVTPERELKTIPFNLAKAMAGDNTEDILLQDEDKVVIHNIWETKQKEIVSIMGEVNKQGDYRLTQNMRVNDLIFRAGGAKDNAYLKNAELTRVVVDQEGMKTERLDIDLEKALKGDEEANILLRKYDTLKVRIIPDWKEKRIALVKGEFKFPGYYNLGKEERLSSLIKRAGDYADDVYLKGAVFTRKSVKITQQKRLNELISKQENEVIAISAKIAEGAIDKDDLSSTQQMLLMQKELLKKLKAVEVTGRILVKLVALDKLSGSEYDFKLMDGDELFIPARPNTVEVMGEVYNPTSIVYLDNKTVNYYLDKVGGPTKEADDDEIYVVKVDGSVISRSQEGFFGISWDEDSNRWITGGFMGSKLDPGDAVLVPRELDKIQWLKGTSQITQILYQIALAAGITIAVF